MLRAIEKNQCRTAYIPETLVQMRLGGATTSSIRNLIKGNLEILASF